MRVCLTVTSWLHVASRPQLLWPTEHSGAKEASLIFVNFFSTFNICLYNELHFSHCIGGRTNRVEREREGGGVGGRRGGGGKEGEREWRAVRSWVEGRGSERGERDRVRWRLSCHYHVLVSPSILVLKNPQNRKQMKMVADSQKYEVDIVCFSGRVVDVYYTRADSDWHKTGTFASVKNLIWNIFPFSW